MRICKISPNEQNDRLVIDFATECIFISKPSGYSFELSIVTPKESSIVESFSFDELTDNSIYQSHLSSIQKYVLKISKITFLNIRAEVKWGGQFPRLKMFTIACIYRSNVNFVITHPLKPDKTPVIFPGESFDISLFLDNDSHLDLSLFYLDEMKKILGRNFFTLKVLNLDEKSSINLLSFANYLNENLFFDKKLYSLLFNEKANIKTTDFCLKCMGIRRMIDYTYGNPFVFRNFNTSCSCPTDIVTDCSKKCINPKLSEQFSDHEKKLMQLEFVQKRPERLSELPTTQPKKHHGMQLCNSSMDDALQICTNCEKKVADIQVFPCEHVFMCSECFIPIEVYLSRKRIILFMCEICEYPIQTYQKVL